MLSFRDEAGKDYQRAFLPINANGIVSFSLPEDKPALSIGKNHQWSLVVVCGDTLQPECIKIIVFNSRNFSKLHAAFKVKLQIDKFLIDCHFVVMFFCHTRKQFCDCS